MSIVRGTNSPRRGETLCLEDLPRLSIADLRAAGALPFGKYFMVRVYAARLNTPTRVDEFIVDIDADSSTIAATHARYGEYSKTEIRIVYKKCGRVGTYFFVCPLTDKTVRDIYLIDGRFCSRHAYISRYATQVESKIQRLMTHKGKLVRQIRGDGYPPATGKRLARLVADLKSMAEFELLTPDDDHLIYRYDAEDDEDEERDALNALRRLIEADLTRRKRAAARAGLTPTDLAIKACEPGADYISPWHASAAINNGFEPLVARLDERLWGEPREPWPGLALPRAVAEDHPSLDLRVINRRGLLHGGELEAWTMRMTLSGPDPTLVYAGADLSGNNLAHLRLAWREGQKPFRQVIGLLEGRNGRWVFWDPGADRPCDVIFYRQGCFASRQSQHLVNRSQVRGNRGLVRPGSRWRKG